MPDIEKLYEIFEGLLEAMRKADDVYELGAALAMAFDQWQKDRRLTLEETNGMLETLIACRKQVYTDMGDEGLE